MKTFLTLVLLAATLSAQLVGPARRVRSGAGEPSSGECATAADVGKVYVVNNTQDTSNALRTCSKTGVSTYQWITGSGGTATGAPTDATYIMQTANGATSAEQALSALATGLVKVTTGTGVLSVGVAGTDYAAVSHTHAAGDVTSGTMALARGGTNQGSWTASRCVQVSSDGTTLESAAAGCNTSGGVNDPGGNGVMVRTALNTTVGRTITAGTGASVANGDGVSANPQVSADLAVVQSRAQDQLGTDNTYIDTGGDDTYAANPASGTVCTGYEDGMRFFLRVTTTNTGAATFAPCGLAAKSIVLHDGSALSDGDIATGRFWMLTYVLASDHFRLPPTLSSGSGDVTAVGDCATGSCYQSVTANQILAGPASGAAGQAASRAMVGADLVSALMDLAVTPILETFCGNTMRAAQGSHIGDYYGVMGWSAINVGQTGSMTMGSDANHSCLLTMTTGTTGNIRIQPHEDSGVNDNVGTPEMNPTTHPNFQWRASVQISSTTSINAAVGWCSVANGYKDCSRSATDTRPGIWFKYSASDSDTNWELVYCDTTPTCNTVDTGVAAAANTTVNMGLRATTAGTIIPSINGSDMSAISSGMANTALRPYFWVETTASAARSMQARLWRMVLFARTN